MLDLADFALHEQPEDNLMVSISRAWYIGSYTMAAKPIKSLELHYTVIQFLIIGFINVHAHPLALLFNSVNARHAHERVIAIVDFSLGRSVGWFVGWFGC